MDEDNKPIKKEWFYGYISSIIKLALNIHDKYYLCWFEEKVVSRLLGGKFCCKSDLSSIFFLSSMFFWKLKRKWHDSSVALNSSLEMGGVSPINWFN